MSSRIEENAEKAPEVDGVEAQIRAAIAEAAANVEASAEAAPSDLAEQAEAAASAANVGTVWTNVVVGLIAGLERFRLAHDKVAGGGPVKPPGSDGDDDRARKLVAQIKREAENGASPTRIEQLIADSGVFVEA